MGAMRPVAVIVPPGVWHALRNESGMPAGYLNVTDRLYRHEDPDNWRPTPGVTNIPDMLMLPFFRTPEEVDTFARLVRGRAKVMILVETAASVVRIRQILSVSGIDEVMFGLNDLHLQLDVSNHFEVFASPLLDGLASEVQAVGLPLSIGGVARVDDTDLPIPPDLVYAQFPRLGATGAWIARSFSTAPQPNATLDRPSKPSVAG
jgi:HpcH/HpaI aldolase/citrate lyase family